MRVGVFLGNNVPQAGGNFTFADNLIDALLRGDSRHEFFVFYYGPVRYSENSKIRFIPLSNHLDRFRNQFVFKSILRYLGIEPETNLQKAAHDHRIEIMWFLTHTYEGIKIPFISTVLDLEHRVHPFFPEVSVTGNTWENRENYFSSTIPKAAYVIVGTEAGKREIIRFYHAEEKSIRVLPFPAPSFVHKHSHSTDIIRKYNISQPYLFYPAQFWPHKNHIGLLMALKLLHEKHSLEFSLILSGSDKGNLKYVKEKVKKLGLEGKVQILGFVPTEDLVWLYKKAFAMVFVSFFGPDNLPPIEAFALGCPVIAAGVSGAEEQLGDAAILVNPGNEEEIALAVKRLHDNPEIRDILIKRGFERSKWSTVDYINGVISIFDEFEKYRRCWSSEEVYVHI